jgi:glycosyltransferase involved in cell wall biosynthesis
LNVELIIVDNGSTDGTASMVREMRIPRIKVRYILEQKTGKSSAQNTGIGAAVGDVIVFTDDDVRPQLDWIRNVSDPIFEGRYDAIAGNVRIAPHLLRPWMTEKHQSWLASTSYLNPTEPEAAVSANMAVARGVFDRIPRFDTELGPGRLGFWDDTLFSLQLKHAGFRLGSAPNALVEHHFDISRLTRSSFLARATGEGQSLAYVAWHWKHEDRVWPSLRATRREIELALKRRLYAKAWQHPEGMPTWEMELVTGIAFLRHFEKMSQQPRAYEKHGFSKLAPR